MGDWPYLSEVQSIESTPIRSGAYSYPTCYLSTGAANTKGTYVQAIASLAYDAMGIIVTVGYADGAFEYLLDIAIGAAGYETIIISNLVRSACVSYENFGSNVYIPIAIPAGTRLSARAQSNGASKTTIIGIHPIYGPFQQWLSKVITYGANISTTMGVTVDPGGSANTKGAYSEITSSSDSLKGFFLGFGSHGVTRAYGEWMVDIAIGAAGSEKIIFPNIYLGCIGNISIQPRFSTFIPINIPVGTRIAARAQTGLTAAGTRIFDIVLYGLE